MLSALVKEASDKVQVTVGVAQDGAGGTKSVCAIDGVAQTATDVVAEYVKMTGAGRARLVPVSYVDELLATLVAGGATVVEPLAGVPVEVCDIKGRAAAGELIVADVRTIGAEFSPACRLGAEIAVAEDARVPGYVVVCMRKCCIPWVAEVVEAKACSAEDVTVSATGPEELRVHGFLATRQAMQRRWLPRSWRAIRASRRCAIRVSRRTRALRVRHRSWWVDLARTWITCGENRQVNGIDLQQLMKTPERRL